MKKAHKPKWDEKKQATRLIFHDYCVPTMIDDNIVSQEDLDRIGSFLESDDNEMRMLGHAMLDAFYEQWKEKGDKLFNSLINT
jgi:predicted alpha/beta hydrolase family esterase